MIKEVEKDLLILFNFFDHKMMELLRKVIDIDTLSPAWHHKHMIDS